MRLLACVLLTLSFGLAGLAAAQCNAGPDMSTLSVEGFGTAYYHDLTTDRANDRIEFFGGVCVAGQGIPWTLLADRVVLAGLSSTLELRAAEPTVLYEGWRLQAAALVATTESLRLSAVHLDGPGASGTADRLTLDLTKGEAHLSGVAVGGETFVVRGTSATLTVDSVQVQGAIITTCTCAGTPFYVVRGDEADVDLVNSSVELRNGSLVVGGLEVPLRTPLDLDEAKLADLKVPIRIAYVADDAASGTTGTGLGVTFTDLPLGLGVNADLGVTGLDPGHPLAPAVNVDVAGGEQRASFGATAGGPRYSASVTHALTPWLDAGFLVRGIEDADHDYLNEGVLSLAARTPLAPLRGNLGVRAFAAGSAQGVGGDGPVGARLGVSVDATARTPATPLGSGALIARAEVTDYPGLDAVQWGVRLRPSWDAPVGPGTATLAYDVTLTNAGSPFTTALDRLEPRSRLRASYTVEGAWRGAAVDASARATYDLVDSGSAKAGLNGLRLHTGATVPIRAWRVKATVDAELAGILDPGADRDGWLLGGVAATDGSVELGTQVRYRWQPDATGFDLLELSAAAPFEVDDVTLKPYLALDFAPLLRGEAPALRGHGLDATFVTCCGTFTVGYRADGATWTARVSVDLNRRPPGAGESVEAACAPPAAELSARGAAVGAPPARCTRGSAGDPAGIMSTADAPPAQAP